MRRHGSITSLSWNPSEAIEGSVRAPFEVGMVVAVTAARVASVHAGQLERDELTELSSGHRREERKRSARS